MASASQDSTVKIWSNPQNDHEIQSVINNRKKDETPVGIKIAENLSKMA